MEILNFKKINAFLISVILPLLVLTSGIVKAQLPVPVINCVSVEDDGSLTVSWSIPSGTFDGFRLFYKKLTDPLSNSIDFTNTTISTNLPVADGQTVGYEIYLSTFNIGPPAQTSAESNHLRSMMLTVSNFGTGTGIARLDWNRITAGNNGIFNIFRKDNLADPFPATPIGSTNNLIYYDTITYSPTIELCDEDNPAILYYMITFSSGSCVANSSTSAGSFSDDNPPEDPKLSLVTINASGLAEISWLPSPTDDVAGYSIGVKVNGLYYDHFDVGNTTTFLDDQTSLPTYHDPCTEVVTYVLKAKDQCNNPSSGAINFNYPHNTILLNGETETLCDRKATLVWNEYINMDPPVSSYKVYRSGSGGPDIEIANISPLPLGSTYSFIDPELLTAGVPYTYQVAAVNSDATKISRSCRILLTPDPEPLAVFEMDYLTVVNNEYIDLYLNSNPPTSISSIDVSRSPVDGTSVEFLFNRPWDGISPVSISDESAEVNETSYYYKISALDDCGFELATTNTSRSIFLQIEDIGNDRYRLSWNAYEDWGANLLEYDIYRIADGVIETGFPVIVPANQLTFDDFAGDLVANRTTYYVMAVRNDDATSRSNEVLLPADAEVIIPNAFRPDGISPIFKPRIKNIEPGSYLFTIYNRWGQLVFSSNDPSIGWNGQFNGAKASQDIYAWGLTFNDLTGKKASKRGSVLLLR